MGSAQDWERENAGRLNVIRDAMADKDPYLAEEFRELIAPAPSGVNVRHPDAAENAKTGRVLEVTDPATGKLDNTGGPAVIKTDGTRKWYRLGLLHNATGPAVIKPNGAVHYYYFGTRCKSAAELDDMVARAETFAQTSRTWRNVTA